MRFQVVKCSEIRVSCLLAFKLYTQKGVEKMRRKERKLKGKFGASLSEVEFGQQRGMWLKRNFVKSGSISLKVSFTLREVIGNEEVYCEREIVRKVWSYANKKNLMDSGWS